MRKMKKSDCDGCENDFYNGHNALGVERCWSFADAELVQVKPLSVDQMNPESYLRGVKPIWRPNCYRQKRMIFAQRNTWGWLG